MSQAIVTTLSGIVLGFLLNEGMRWVRDRLGHHESRRRVRLLLQLENERNLKALDDFWHAVNSAAPQDALGYSDEELAFRRRQRLAADFLAPWSHRMWESHATILPAALSAEEIVRMDSVHTDLDTFSTMRARLHDEFARPATKALWEAYGQWRHTAAHALASGAAHVPSFADGHAIDMFNQRTADTWSTCEQIHERLWTLGNPILGAATPHIARSLGSRSMRLAHAPGA